MYGPNSTWLVTSRRVSTRQVPNYVGLCVRHLQGGLFSRLRQLRPVVRSLTADAAKTVVRAFVACRLGYCNCLLYGITDTLFTRLQSLQNAATRLVTGTRRRDHITPVLRNLHWLPVRRRVDFKLALLVYKSLHGLTPSYLSEDCRLVSSDKFRRRLRSADSTPASPQGPRLAG